jgi:hypothetical protein
LSARQPPARYAGGWRAAGPARPALPVSVFGEDFSLLIRRRRLRIARRRIYVLQ